MFFNLKVLADLNLHLKVLAENNLLFNYQGAGFWFSLIFLCFG